MTDIEIGSDVEGLKNYLKIHVDMRSDPKFKMDMRNAGYAYSCLESFVLQHGTPYEEISPIWSKYRPGVMKACFYNAFILSSRTRGRLAYCEGYAMNKFMPVHHAWNVDPEGRVVDVTWNERTVVGQFGTAYLGIKFPLPYVRKTRTNQNGCMLDRWEEDWPLLKSPFSFDKLS